MIGDNDPEDAYDASDPADVRLTVLARVAAALPAELDPARRHRRRAELARLLTALAAELELGAD